MPTKRLKDLPEVDMEAALKQMSEDQREHLRFVIASLLDCYIGDTRGLLLLHSESLPYLQIIAVNATDMEAAQLLANADNYMNFRMLEGAPPKEMMN